METSTWRCTMVLVITSAALGMSGCIAKKKQSAKAAEAHTETKTTASPGQFLPGDGMPDAQNIDFDAIADATPKVEVLSENGNQPYEVYGQRYHPVSSAKGFRETGKASWYGTKFHGRKTSSGELYDMYKMTAAHRTLPLPSYARVTNLDNAKQVVVKINDRGPFVAPDSRIIDLSYAAAGKLGLLNTGTANIELEGLTADTTTPAVISQSVPAANASENTGAETLPSSLKPIEFYFVQVGAFSSAENANKQLASMTTQGMEGLVVVNGGLHKVRLGPYESREQAAEIQQEIYRSTAIRARLIVAPSDQLD